MIQKTFLAIAFLTISFASAQGASWDSNTLSDSRTMDAFAKLTNKVTKKNLNVNNIKGSPYYNEKFSIAEVDYFGKTLEDKTFLRYNAFSDELEMGTYPEQKTTEQILLKNNKIVSNFGGQKFMYLPFKTKEGFTKVGYLVVLHESEKYSLYLKRTKVFMEATVARTSLERAFPARFVENTEYYYNYEGNTLQYLKTNKSGLNDTFKEHSDYLKKYLNENKVRYKDQSSLTKLFKTINSLL